MFDEPTDSELFELEAEMPEIDNDAEAWIAEILGGLSEVDF